MTRADTRLVLAIFVTSVVTSAVVVLVSRALDDDAAQRALVQRLDALERRLAVADEIERAAAADAEASAAADVPGVVEDYDEVACVLENYEPPGCEKFRRGPITATTTGLPETLDRAMISAAVGRVKPEIAACGHRFRVHGKVKVRVRVASDGTVTRTAVQETPDEDLAACVSRAISDAAFPTTRTGGSFSYPFVF